jgi:hypothetical protein
MITYSTLQIRFNNILNNFYDQIENIFKNNQNNSTDDKKSLIKNIILENNKEVNEIIIDVSQQTSHFDLKEKELKRFLLTLKDTLPSKKEIYDRDSFSSTESQEKKFLSYFNSEEDYISFKEDNDLNGFNDLESYVNKLVEEDSSSNSDFLNFYFKYRKITRDKILLDIKESPEILTEYFQNFDDFLNNNSILLEENSFFFPIIVFSYKSFNFFKIYKNFYF